MTMLEALSKVSKGRLSPMDIAQAVNERRMQLWQTPNCDSAVITELVNYPQMRECRIIVAAGRDLSSWWQVWPSLEGWARGWDCSAIKLEGRKGWKRVLAPLGFEQTAIVLEKKL